MMTKEDTEKTLYEDSVTDDGIVKPLTARPSWAIRDVSLFQLSLLFMKVRLQEIETHFSIGREQIQLAP